ncbi:hypothetical protein D0T49_03555 [Paludibacter sp. 221]|uniref:hypothetical protein n=1 Tax=Paludibacter sp. 221 TaxID=2302939 RepID=UPI0013D70E0D|nr:hypothetical protein [Paludibacter sp. 221]NDV46116.1 hypothetical protein [Paludibacter sp. 221]
MWETTFKHSELGVEEVTHDFGNQIKIVANLRKKTVCRVHGEIIVKEFDYEPDLERYIQFLENIYFEVNPPKKHKEDEE